MLSELQTVAEALSKRLGRVVAIDDPDLKLLVHTAHHGEKVDQVRLDAVMQRQTLGAAYDHLMAQGIAAADGPVRVPGREDLSMLPRICVPIRYRDELLGYVWLLDDGLFTDAELQLADDAADEAAAVMYRERLLGDLQRGREREMLRDLLTEDLVLRRHAAETLSGTLLAKGAVTAVVARGAADGPALETALQRAARVLPEGTAAHLARVDHGVVLTTATQRVDGLAEALLRECRSTFGGPVLVGVGDAVGALVDANQSYTQARRAIDVASVVPSLGPVARWSGLGVYGLLVQLGLQELPTAALPAPLRKLFEVDKHGVLAETLEVYLDNASDPAAAVAQLQVHRTTMYYRLARVTELTGLDLKDGGDRLAVHLGLKLARLVGR